MRFTVYFSEAGAPKEGLSGLITIWQITPSGTVTNPIIATAMTAEIGGGFYHYDNAALSPSNDYVATVDSQTLQGAEQYADCIATTQGDVAIIKAIETGRWKIDKSGSPHQMIFYDTDGTTPLLTCNLTVDAAASNYSERTIVP